MCHLVECMICYGCHWYLHEPMGTHANWRATVWWSQWQLFTMIIIQFKMTPSRKYRHHFCFDLFATIVSQFLKEIYLIQDIFINFNGSLFCNWRFLLNQSVIFLCQWHCLLGGVIWQDDWVNVGTSEFVLENLVGAWKNK